MKRLALTALAAGLALASSEASAKFNAGNYYNFTSAYVGTLGQGKSGAFSVQPSFLGNPRQIGFSSMLPTLVGNTVNIPIPGGRHSARWWRVFTMFQVQQVYRVIASAGLVGGSGGGKGVPGPVAGAGLPFLAGAALLLMHNRRKRAASGVEPLAA